MSVEESSHRPQFVFDDAAGLRSAQDVAAVLQARLRTLAVLLLPLALVLATLGLAAGYFDSIAKPFIHPPYIGWPLAWGVILGTAGFIGLRPDRQIELPKLRRWEAISAASGVVIYVIGWVLLLGKELPPPVINALRNSDVALGPQLLAAGGSVFWVSAMITYGVYIPNTWQRCAVVMVLMSTLATVPDFLVLRTWHVPSDFLWSYFGGRLFWLVDGGLLAVYGARRIEALRSDVAAARKLGQYVLKSPSAAEEWAKCIWPSTRFCGGRAR